MTQKGFVIVKYIFLNLIAPPSQILVKQYSYPGFSINYLTIIITSFLHLIFHHFCSRAPQFLMICRFHCVSLSNPVVKRKPPIINPTRTISGALIAWLGPLRCRSSLTSWTMEAFWKQSEVNTLEDLKIKKTKRARGFEKKISIVPKKFCRRKMNNFRIFK